MERKPKVSFFKLLKDAFTEWNEDDAFSNSVIISYYTIFSLPGLLVIIINVAGYFFGQEAVTNQISTQISSAVGGDTAKSVEQMIANASQHPGTTLATMLSILTLLLGATGAFYQLRQILNRIWGVKPKAKNKILQLLVDRVFSLGLILVIGFLLLVSLVLSAAVASISKWVGQNISQELITLFTILDFILSISIITLLFASIFKFLPDIKISLKEVWPGAIMSSVLFVIAKFGLAIYFAKANPGSTYGAAGSIILLMLWVTYSGLILLYGAEFTKVYSQARGARVVPKSTAEVVTQDDTERTHATTPHRSDIPDDRDVRRADLNRKLSEEERSKPSEQSPDIYHED